MVDGPRPLILIRGFGGADVQDEQRDAYQGFNNGTVYPERRGENYIYEGFVLRALKSTRYPYRDATNVVSYYPQEVPAPPEHDGWPEGLLRGTVAVDVPMARQVLAGGISGTLWVYRYYDLRPRTIECYGKGLARLIDIIRQGAERVNEEFAGVDIVAHSMGGLVARAALTQMGSKSEELIHRIVTLGTPHRGIAFQRLPHWLVGSLPKADAAADELAAFNPDGTGFLKIPFSSRKILTVVGTDYRAYGAKAASSGNRISTLLDEGTLSYNRSDGLVKQASAQLPGAPRTFIHKCHGGRDSLATSREAYEIAMRFFHGTRHVQLWLDRAKVRRGKDLFGRSEFYLGVCVKPRYVDFEIFHQSPEAENCYGPFRRDDFTDDLPELAQELSLPLSASGDDTTGWAGPDRLIWEGWIDGSCKPAGVVDESLVFRLDVYVGERDAFGIGFFDNVVFRKQYYVQAVPGDAGEAPTLYLHTGERFLAPDVTTDALEAAARGTDPAVKKLEPSKETSATWAFSVAGSGFDADLSVSITDVVHAQQRASEAAPVA
ncbi:esterase/lipase family protein [Streptomyces sp. H27-D2]|uniref:esterase/lipase family protein n=1 Tax=Streptomyces sp. H27-D2 TaxID=3046304 RepID=UPI002DBAD85D|nr:hypothetical protein [Streptomyces sp. H27-D2]MEC4017895.1 hypothetical protein [Streptomyces sp. H27-D2]